MKKLIKKLLAKKGYSIVSAKVAHADMDKDFFPLYDQARHATLTTIERMYALYQACKYVSANNIQGDIVECGIWKGGSSMMAALCLKFFGATDRQFFLYDTYEGMSDPTEKDVSFRGDKMKENWKGVTQNDIVFCYSPLEEVQENMKRTGYPFENIHFVKGKVEDTLPQTLPGRIAILRLDTDWYESTYHELKHLYPLLQPGGVLIIDDYGYWKGAREAVDQYFREINEPPLLQRIDYTGRMLMKR